MRRVVVVEDNEAFAKYVRCVLEHGGTYVVTVTQSADDVLRLAREPETVAVLLDVSLRGTQYAERFVDGIELSRILKADRATGGVPIVIVTAHAMAGDEARFLRESGADAFLRKPVVDPKGLLATVDRVGGRGTGSDS